MTFLGLATTNVRRRPLRSLLGLGSIAIMSVMCVATLTFIKRQRVADASDSSDSRLIVVAYGGNTPLPFTHGQTIRQLPGVTNVEWVRTYRAVDPNADSAFTYVLWAASTGVLSSLPRGFVTLSPELAETWQKDRQGLLAPRALAERLGWKPGADVTVVLGHRLPTGTTGSGQLQFHFLGSYDGGFQHGVLGHFDQVSTTLSDQRVQRFMVTCESQRCPALLDEIDKTFETTADSTLTMTEASFAGSVVQAVSTIPNLLSFVGVLVIAVSAIMTGCTISISLRERGTEIATLRALGFSRRQVVVLLFSESLLVACAGGLLGSLLPFLVTKVHPISIGVPGPGGALLSVAFSNLVVPVDAVGVSLAVALVFGVVVALLPVSRVLRESVVEGLAG